jgi:hypothetical protein
MLTTKTTRFEPKEAVGGQQRGAVPALQLRSLCLDQQAAHYFSVFL